MDIGIDVKDDLSVMDSNFHLSCSMRSRIDGKCIDTDKLPDMLEVQKESYSNFLYGKNGDQSTSGISSVFKSTFPVVDSSNKATLDFVSYVLKEPKFNEDESIDRGITYAATIRALMKLILWKDNEETKEKELIIQEQEVYISNIPLMTEKGTFIVNGCEYVVVSQMHRSPGVFFDHDKGKSHSSGRILYSARIIPYRGSWLDFEFDVKDLIYFRVDRKRKIYVTTLLYALDFKKQEIIDFFYNKVRVYKKDNNWHINIKLRNFIGFKNKYDLSDVGRVKINAKLNINVPETCKVLTKEDILHVVKELIAVKD
uniref:DNA-directed RNA polymerase n=1 Tax=Biomphalaria glabrata TaxID=6526 RepID=A0A2C9M2Z5_BIOGL